MHPVTAEDRPRILFREFRRRKQPKRWESLPSLQLSPPNRPLYVCPKCQFPNPFSDLCPWCSSACELAMLIAAVRRRVSSPTLLNDAQKFQLGQAGPPPSPHVIIPASSLAPRPLSASDRAPASAFASRPGDTAVVRRRHRNAVLLPATTVVATPTVDCDAEKLLQPIFAQLVVHCDLESHERVAAPLATSRPSRHPTKRASRKQPLSSPQNPRTPSRRTRTRMVHHDVELTCIPSSEPRTSPEPPSPCSSSPGLRHKRRMSVIRQRSSCSLRRRATTNSSVTSFRRDSAASVSPSPSPRPKIAPGLPASLPNSFTLSVASPSTRTKNSSSVRFSAPPPAAVAEAAPRRSLSPSRDDLPFDGIPLGHPQRPLYTAIRKNMSRPSSPAPSATSGGFAFHSPAPSPAPFSSFPPPSASSPPVTKSLHNALAHERGTRSLDIDPRPALAPQARFGSLSRAAHALPLFPSAGAGAGTGCSVSGATELRMNLARSRSAEGVPGDFTFREVKPMSSGKGLVKRKVKGLKKAIKGLLRAVM
ncbi:uncharacterized protein BXZ73DRAFT_96420 [Epithele typhae]|uniref:uncharacterized protein n=1 Tax=Epithele typhae TaxID=378194 RepID=UPI002007333E|nr:uncharacterized protein BXZ73DRAFT_96420 [Epithele typhae]KAH9945431.1 hypothetical protein BXZ73DRAFT_96420 [Epithele typhae]